MSGAPTAAAAADSVPLDSLGQDEQRGERKQHRSKHGVSRVGIGNLKVLISLFFIFVVVVSDAFTNSVLSGFGDSAVRCRSPTSWGVVLQGIFLVIFYILSLYLIENRIL